MASGTEAVSSRVWVLIVAGVVLAVAVWFFLSIKPWQRETTGPKPESTLHILGRDDEASKRREAELEAMMSASAQRSSRPAASASASASPSAR